MKPLSNLKFLIGSLRKVIPFATTVCLAVTLLYLLSLIKIQLFDQLDSANLNLMNHTAYVGSELKGMSQAEFDELRNNPLVDRVIPVTEDYFMAELVLGKGTNTSNQIFYVSEANLNKMVENYRIKLIDGTLPKNRKEVLLHEVIAKQNHIKAGDTIKQGETNIKPKTDIKVTGIIKSDAYINVGLESEENLNPGANNVTAIVIAKAGGQEALDHFLETQYASKYNVNTAVIIKEFIRNSISTLNVMLILIGVLMVVVIGVLLGNISLILYENRKKEFELLHAVGYTKRRLGFKILIEMLSCSMVGYVLGILISMTAAYVINVCYWSDKGLDMPILSPGSMLSVLILPVAVTALSLFNPLKILKFRDIL